LELGDVGRYWQWAMVMKLERSAGEAGLLEASFDICEDGTEVRGEGGGVEGFEGFRV
jgi:hypothetical protein